jgi:hypothetical protein
MTYTPFCFNMTFVFLFCSLRFMILMTEWSFCLGLCYGVYMMKHSLCSYWDLNKSFTRSMMIGRAESKEFMATVWFLLRLLL